MKFSFVAVALLAARATAIPVAAGDAAGSQDTHGALGLPGTDALTGLAEKLGVPVEALLEQLLGALKGVVPVKRDGSEGDDQATHGSLGLPGTDALTGLAEKLGVPVEALLEELLGALKGVVPVKRDGSEGTNALTKLSEKLGVPVEALLKKILRDLNGVPHFERGEDLLKAVLGTVEDLLEGNTKALTQEVLYPLWRLEDLLGKIIKSDDKNLNENILIKVSALNNTLNNVLPRPDFDVSHGLLD